MKGKVTVNLVLENRGGWKPDRVNVENDPGVSVLKYE